MPAKYHQLFNPGRAKLVHYFRVKHMNVGVAYNVPLQDDNVTAGKNTKDDR